MSQIWIWNGRVAIRFRPLLERLGWERAMRARRRQRAVPDPVDEADCVMRVEAILAEVGWPDPDVRLDS
jgi:hypothetical protein